MQGLEISKILKLGVYSLLLGIISLVLLQSLFFSNRLASSKFSDLKDLVKMWVQGDIQNKTTHSLLVTDYHTLQTLPPGTSSKGLRFHDVDALVIQHPTLLEGKRYQSGVFKFCDFVSFRIYEENGLDVMKPNNGAFLCRLLHDYRYFETLRESCLGNPFGNITIPTPE